jgi:hypothetical protein
VVRRVLEASHMKQRPTLVACIVLGTVIGGCGSSSSRDDSQRADSQPVDSQPAFRGVYVPAGQGAIGAVTFADDGGYMLMPSGCAAQSCTETGTYALDPAGTTLKLTVGATGASRSLPVRVLATAGTKDGVTTQGLLEGEPQRLLEPTDITSALIEGQPVKLLSNGTEGGGAATDVQVAVSCLSGIPTGHTSSDAVAAYWARCPKGVLT